MKNGLVIVFIAVSAIILLPNAYSAVLINEILANGVDDPDSEWIELFNNESFGVNLTNWNISETSSGNLTLNTGISAKSFIILAGDFSAFNKTYPNVNLSGIKIINITISNFNLADTSGEARLYNSSGELADTLSYAQASGKAFENVSIGRHPDGSSAIFNLSTLTPGAKNDNQAPKVNKWINPPRNNTNIGALINISVNITDDAAQVNSTIVNFNGTNFSMAKNGDIWLFAWNTSLNVQKAYNITIFFNDSYGKSGSDTLFNITVNNSPRIISFSPPNLTQTIAENSTLNFNANASDPDDALLNYSWFIDNIINSTKPENFSYTPGFSDNGTHTINATIKDAFSNQVSVKWDFKVTNLNRAPILEDIQNKTIPKNINLSFNITANDQDNDSLTFSANHSGFAVSKLNNSLAVVSWRPTNRDLGSNIINFTVSDGFLADSKIIIIAVNSTNNTAPNITSLPKTTATINEKYTYDADAIDLDNDTLTFSLGTNASGMSIDGSTGLIIFTPSSFGFFTVNLSATDFIEATSQIYNLTVAEGSRLKITDVDAKVDGKKSSNIGNGEKIGKEAKPGSVLEFKITVKNDFLESENIDIEGIKVKAAIEDIGEGDDLEEESSEFDLNAQNDRTVTLKFELPLDVDEGIFDVAIDAEGEAENGSFYEQHFQVELEVEKEKHDLRLLKAELAPTLINCNRILELNYKIINIGQEDEENAALQVSSDSLGLNLIEKGISIDEGTEDNLFSKSMKIKINDNIESGGYQITANIYSDDNKLMDTKTFDIRVQDCIKIKEAREPEVILVTPLPEPPKKTQAIKEEIKAPAAKISFEEADKNVLLLALSTFVFTMFFAAVAIVLYTSYYL